MTFFAKNVLSVFRDYRGILDPFISFLPPKKSLEQLHVKNSVNFEPPIRHWGLTTYFFL